MKNFKSSLKVLIELRGVGSSVVVARVSSSIGFERNDLAYLSKIVLARLLPVSTLVFPLYDGTFLLIPDDECELLSCASVLPVENRDLESFTGFFELQDGKIHSVEVSLAQSDDSRCDCTFGDTRYVRLCGEVSIEVDDDDELKEE